MIRAGFALLAGSVFTVCAAAQVQTNTMMPKTSSPSAQTQTKAATLPSGTAVNAELNSSVDSRKVKAGEKVEAHTTEAVKYDGKIIVPKGAKLEGHVAEATARSKGDSGSTLAIQFDKAIPKKGEEIPLNVMILAIAAPQSDFFGGTPGPGSDPMGGMGASAAGGSPMGASRPQPPPTGMPADPSGAAAGAPVDSTTEPRDRAQLPASSRGVYGLKDLKLMMVSSNKNQTTVITSSGKAVHLDDGTRLLLVAQAETAAAPSR
ncbi:MAG: hypothetical protein ACYDCG_17880 [Candidatus Acidiferrales bacterium]